MPKTLGNLLVGLAIASFAIAWSKAPETRIVHHAAATALQNFQTNLTALHAPDGTDPAFIFVGP